MRPVEEMSAGSSPENVDPSVTMNARPPAAANETARVSALTWIKSAMIPTKTSGRANATPASPGARDVIGDCAFQRCVVARMPASKARWAALPSASLCPADTTTPRSHNHAVDARAPGRSGAIVMIATGARPSSSAIRSGVGSRNSPGSWAPGRHRNGPSRWTPSAREPSAAGSAMTTASESRTRA